MREALFIGVDGGGSRCAARLADAAGRVLGEGTGGPANARLGEIAFQSVTTACRGAAEAAGLGDANLGRVHAGFGLAGANQPMHRRAVLGWPHPFASLAVDTDAYAAWMGAFKGRDGAILIVGTGSAALAVVGGRRIDIGGHGAEIGDEGSGMAIGRAAIRRSLWALDGMAPQTPLVAEILARFHGDPAEMVTWGGKARPTDFAQFAPLVFDHAERRDPLAAELIHKAALDVERLINRLIDLGAPAIATIGSVLSRIQPWLAPPFRAPLVPPEGDAMDGAILMARAAAAERVDA